jgi:hypothetical protein
MVLAPQSVAAAVPRNGLEVCHDPHGFEQVADDVVRFHPIAVARTPIVGYQHGDSLQVASERDIAAFVTNHYRVCRLEADGRSTIQNQLGFRFAAFAIIFRSMRTRVESIHTGADFFDHPDKPFIDFMHAFERQTAASHTGLIGHNDDRVAALPELTQSCRGSWKKLQQPGIIEVVAIVNNRSVAIKNDRALSLRLPCGQWRGHRSHRTENEGARKPHHGPGGNGQRVGI